MLNVQRVWGGGGLLQISKRRRLDISNFPFWIRASHPRHKCNVPLALTHAHDFTLLCKRLLDDSKLLLAVVSLPLSLSLSLSLAGFVLNGIFGKPPHHLARYYRLVITLAR